MSNLQQSFNAGQTQGQTQATTEKMNQSSKEKANAATQSQSVKQVGWQGQGQEQEQSPGFLQQGAMGSLMNSLGKNESKGEVSIACLPNKIQLYKCRF
ncbi:hypothetical protein COLO4_16012 [Corchorus olitorius]|uniref:Uncharacterized protein n=1 Tax=Corchorus olitorius TaxID=93759 RepID=A0A1R3JKB5_9ROSI|nr:hypothetical protein COLO4_16012 [Corchorus olitorius]